MHLQRCLMSRCHDVIVTCLFGVECRQSHAPSPLSEKRNLTAPEITASGPRNYGSCKLGDFVLKIA